MDIGGDFPKKQEVSSLGPFQIAMVSAGRLWKKSVHIRNLPFLEKRCPQACHHVGSDFGPKLVDVREP